MRHYGKIVIIFLKKRKKEKNFKIMYGEGEFDNKKGEKFKTKIGFRKKKAKTITKKKLEILPL